MTEVVANNLATAWLKNCRGIAVERGGVTGDNRGGDGRRGEARSIDHDMWDAT